jgi:hypothetical protein
MVTTRVFLLGACMCVAVGLGGSPQALAQTVGGGATLGGTGGTNAGAGASVGSAQGGAGISLGSGDATGGAGLSVGTAQAGAGAGLGNGGTTGAGLNFGDRATAGLGASTTGAGSTTGGAGVSLGGPAGAGSGSGDGTGAEEGIPTSAPRASGIRAPGQFGPGDESITSPRLAAGVAQFRSLNSVDQTALRKRCKGILGAPSQYDDELVLLCGTIATR